MFQRCDDDIFLPCRCVQARRRGEESNSCTDFCLKSVFNKGFESNEGFFDSIFEFNRVSPCVSAEMIKNENIVFVFIN